MYILFPILAFILGTLIGSFLNVVILRYNTGMSINGRSQCFSCGKTLRWYELLPVVSYLSLRGKCRTCKSAISWQYPAVELITGILFALVYFKFFALDAHHIIVSIYYAVIVSILVVITVYDIRHTIIPDGMVYAFAILSLAKFCLEYQGHIFAYPQILHLLAGPILFLPFFLLWFFSKGTWMGFGDAKLAVAIGWALGLVGGISAIVLAFWIGAAISLGYMAFAKIVSHIAKKYPLSLGLKQLTIKSEIPFAPYLILGTLIVLVWSVDVLQLGQTLGL